MFSYELIKKVKEAKGLQQDKEVIALIDGMNSGNMSQIKSGKRSLTEEQVLIIAKQCNIEPEPLLAMLAAEKAKSPQVKAAWESLSKQLMQSVRASILIAMIAFCGINSENSRETAFS